MQGGLKGQLKIIRKKFQNQGEEFKLAFQAAIFTSPHPQGAALGWYKLALQAGIA